LLNTDIDRILKRIYRKRFFSKKIIKSSELTTIINKSVIEGETLKLFYLWGIYDKRNKNNYDDLALLFLSKFINHIKAVVECPVEFTIVLTDAHAKINLIAPETTSAYSNEIQAWAFTQKWRVVMLSDIWMKYGLTEEQISDYIETMPANSIDKLLMNFSTKYYKDKDKEKGAMRYYAARTLEKKIIEDDFASYIHITAADTRLDYLQPDMPHFHIWTLKKGKSAKPWFLSE